MSSPCRTQDGQTKHRLANTVHVDVGASGCNMCWIYKRIWQRQCFTKFILFLLTQQHTKLSYFFKGVSVFIFLLLLTLFTVAALTFKMLVFKFAVRCGAKRSQNVINHWYTNKYKKHECPPAVTDFLCPPSVQDRWSEGCWVGYSPQPRRYVPLNPIYCFFKFLQNKRSFRQSVSPPSQARWGTMWNYANLVETSSAVSSGNSQCINLNHNCI